MVPQRRTINVRDYRQSVHSTATPFRLRAMIAVSMSVLSMTLSTAFAQEKTTAAPVPETPAKIPAEKPVEVSYHNKPYRVLFSVAFDKHPRFSPVYRQQVLRDLEDAAKRTIGQMWTVHVKENHVILPARASALERLTFDDALPQLGITPDPPKENEPANVTSIKTADVPYDKVFLTTVESLGSRYRISTREWDEATREIHRMETRWTRDPRTVAETAFTLTRELFQPTLTIERINNVDKTQTDVVELWLRAGAFGAIDPEAAQIRKGTLIVPFYRYLNKAKVVRTIQYVPWTYLRVEEFDSGYVKCSVISGLRLPLGTLGRRRVEVMGLVLKPHVDATELKMVLHKNPKKALVGTRVTVHTKTLVNDEDQADPREMITDRNGSLFLSHNPDHGMLWLYIHSGKSLLARLPFATGVREKQTFKLLDDSLRLAVEGDIHLLEGRLIDLVARRSTHFALASQFAKQEKWEEVEKIFLQLEGLPMIEEFRSRLNTIREPALEQAKNSRDRRSVSKIQRLCETMSKLIERHLDPDITGDFKKKLNESR